MAKTAKAEAPAKAAKEKSAARDFVLFVTEGAGRVALEKFGFRPPAARPPKERHK